MEAEEGGRVWAMRNLRTIMSMVMNGLPYSAPPFYNYSRYKDDGQRIAANENKRKRTYISGMTDTLTSITYCM